MRALSFLSTVRTFDATAELGSDTTVAPVVASATDTTAPATKPVKPLRKPSTKRKLAAKPADATVVVAEPEAPAAEPAVKPLGIARTVATIARLGTNFGGTLSDRDHAYISFYAGFAKRDGNVTVRAIADAFQEHGSRPAYGGSAKPHDAGVCVRLHKAGVIRLNADGDAFAFTDLGRGLKSYASANALA